MLPLQWSRWIALDADLLTYQEHVVTDPGFYRVRAVGNDSLVYIGQTGRSLRQRTRAELAKHVMRPRESPPWNDPHTAAPLLWAYRHEDGMEFELSVASAHLDVQMRQCYEDVLLYLHRLEFGHSALCNHGRRHPWWSRATNRKDARPSHRLSSPLEYSSLPVSSGNLDPISSDWLGLSWSDFAALPTAAPIQAARRDMLHLDSIDLMRSAARAAFIKATAVELHCQEETIKKDLGLVLLHLDDLRNRQIEAAKATRAPVPQMPPDEARDALDLLRDPNLIGRIVRDLEHCGMVGEAFNKLAAYLAIVSRKLASPLAILVQSSSSAGKSTLMDTILAMAPPEDVIQLSNLTSQALYYLPPDALRHKTLAICEDQGLAEAAYALKLLQSDGRLTHATVAKAVDGRAVTQFHCVEGPVQLFLTSTSQTIDEELLNRCLVLAVDESREQTHAIQQLQRLLQSRSGLEKRREASGLQALHRNAQRLLRPLVVTNDLDATLPFPCERTRHRRDHAKYLSLIQAIALLHQHQRTLHVDESGTESIAVEPSDIALANRLIDKLLKQSNNELPPQSQRCLESLQGFVQSHCQRDRLTPPEFRFTRRSFREQSGWTDNQLRVHFQRLIDLEFLRVHRGRQGCTYLYELVI